MSIVQPIMEVVINLLTKYIIAPIVSLVINLINYIISIFLYDISCFILALIDYVEVMFRLLAGLEVDGVQLNLGSSSDKGGDLVMQLIRTPEIRDAFLAMVVVGMFLLIITTIFQMIKVEYTTEGAKNAKGPILNKAFKGMANMIMLPALCIFGVIIGNQILDLLDKATKPDSDKYGQSATISGTLFVAAASDAFYREDDWWVNLYTLDINQASTQLLLNIFPIIIDSISDAWEDTFQTEADKDYQLSESERKSYESMIASGTISYWNVGAITMIYNYSKINYLLLIFGGCIVIKTLYSTCFGMIVRLYQCGMLFIISPAVIGMTPINEGGLGKWRSSFIGQVLSAYGVVLALNIFFILVRVLLSIEFNFTSWDSYYFGASMMEGLLKAIIVMGGAISIEKFAKEIGGYFGAADAIGQGKEMQKGISDTAKKAASTAVTVAMAATGAGGAAVGAAKSLGDAMKAGKATGGMMGGLKAGAKHIGDGVTDLAEKPIEYMANAAGIDYQTRADRELAKRRYDSSHEASAASADLRRQKQSFDKANAADESEKAAYLTKQSEWESKLAAAEAAGDKKAAGIARGQITSNKNKIESINVRQETRKSDLVAAENRFTQAKADVKKAQEDTAARKVVKDSQIAVSREAARQAGKSLWSQTAIGGAFASGKKTISGYEDAAAKEGGKEITAAYEHIKKIKSDALEEAAENRNKKVITEKNIVQAGIIKKMTVEEVEVSNKKLDITANSGLSNLNALQSRLDSLNRTDPDYQIKASALNSQIESLTTSLAQSLGVGVGSVSKDIHGNFQVTESYHIDTKNIEAMMEKMIKNGGMNNKAAMQEAINEAIKGKTADQAKMIQEIFEKVVAKYSK